jgi:hypothetical protein
MPLISQQVCGFPSQPKTELNKNHTRFITIVGGFMCSFFLLITYRFVNMAMSRRATAQRLLDTVDDEHGDTN